MEKEKLQHYSIRKLSVGAASVLIGLSFVGLGRSTQVKADTVNDPAVTQTKENAEITSGQPKFDNSAIKTGIEETSKNLSQQVEAQQKTNDQNNEATVENSQNNTEHNKVNTQEQKNDDSLANLQNKDSQQVQKAQESISVESNDNVTNTPKQDKTNQEKTDALDNNTVKTSKFNIKPVKQPVSDTATLLLAQKNAVNNETPVKESNIELTRRGAIQAEQNKLDSRTEACLTEAINFGFKGQFKVEGSAINKKGNQVKLAEFAESNNLNTDLGFNPLQSNWDCEYDGNKIGEYSLNKTDAHHINLLLTVTKDQDFIGDINLNASSPELFNLNFDIPASHYKGVTEETPVVSTVSAGNNSYQFVFKYDPNAYHVWDYPDDKVSTWQNGDTAGAETARIPFISDNLNKTDIYHELEDSHGKTMSADLQNLRRVVQISGSHIPQDINNYGLVTQDQRIYTINADGKLTNENIAVPANHNEVEKKLLADGLTPQQMYDQTPENSYAFSKQADGSYLVGWNFSPQFYEMTDLENTIRDRSFLVNVVDPANADKIVQNTLEFYQGALKNTPLLIVNGVFIGASEPTDFTIKDVTPGDDRHLQDTGFIGVATSSADGNLAKYVNVQTVDDDNNQMIVGKPNLYRGKAGDQVNVKYTVPDNYQLVNGQNIPLVYTLQDTNQPIIIHLQHKRKTVVDSKVIAETIHYNYEDGTKAADDYEAKHVVSSRVGYKDLVSGNITWDGDWSTETFPEVTSPHINGYTANQPKIDAQTVDGNSQDIVKTVVYNANNQKIFVHYVDDTDSQELHTEPLVGKSNTVANYTTGDAIKNYLNQGYDLVSDDTHGQAIRYDADDDHDQTYNVHLKHHISDVIDPKLLNATFDRVITEKLPDGKNKQITQHYIVSRTGKQDQVTKKYTFTNWSSAQVHEDKGDTFDGYTAKITSQSPEAIALIKAGVPTVKAETFTNANNNSTQPVNISENVVITYDANNQKVQINYIDDTLNSTVHSDNLVGKSNTVADYTTASAIKNYLSQGYDLVSDDTQGNPVTFDAHDKVDQVYNVHLKHHISDVTDPKMLNATFDRVVIETLPDGQTKQFKQHYVITRTGKQDQVTKKYAFTNWSSVQVHEDKGDALDGYTAKINSANIDGIALVDDSGVPTVKAEKFTNKNNNSTTPVNVEERVEVGYLPNDQKATITFIDDDAQKDKQVLQTQNLVGKSNTKSSYDTGADIENYLSKGFELVSDDTKGNLITFDAHDKVDQVFTVHLKHHISDVTDPRILSATFDRVITEHTPDGKDKQITQHYVITRTGKQDQVTKKYAWSDWTTAQVHEDKGDTFEGYTPHLSGNNFDSFISLVNGTPIAKEEVFTNENGKLLPKNISEKVDITYTANPQEAAIVFYDDTADTPLQKNTVRGHYGEAIEFTPKVSDVITEYTKKGYVLVSNEFDNQKYAADDKQNVFVVHLKHGTVDVTRSKDVTETIHYIYDNDSKAHDDYVATKQFVNHGTKDLVTGNIVWQNAWTPANDEFAQVNSPEIPGYTPDKSSIPAQKVNVDSKNLEFTVKYSAIPAEPSSSNDPEPSNPVPEKPIETTPDDNISKEESSKPKKHEPAIKKASRTHSTPVIDHFAAPKKVAEIKPGMERKAQAASIEKSSTVSEPRAKELPTTGEKDEDQLGYVGLALASLVGIFGYSIKKRED